MQDLLVGSQRSLPTVLTSYAHTHTHTLTHTPKHELETLCVGKMTTCDSLTGKEEKKSKEPGWKKYCDMPVKERRRFYRCGPDYVTVNDIPTWAKYWHDNAYHFSKLFAGKTRHR